MLYRGGARSSTSSPQTPDKWELSTQTPNHKSSSVKVKMRCKWWEWGHNPTITSTSTIMQLTILSTIWIKWSRNWALRAKRPSAWLASHHHHKIKRREPRKTSILRRSKKIAREESLLRTSIKMKSQMSNLRLPPPSLSRTSNAQCQSAFRTIRRWLSKPTRPTGQLAMLIIKSMILLILRIKSSQSPQRPVYWVSPSIKSIRIEKTKDNQSSTFKSKTQKSLPSHKARIPRAKNTRITLVLSIFHWLSKNLVREWARLRRILVRPKLSQKTAYRLSKSCFKDGKLIKPKFQKLTRTIFRMTAHTSTVSTTSKTTPSFINNAQSTPKWAISECVHMRKQCSLETASTHSVTWITRNSSKRQVELTSSISKISREPMESPNSSTSTRKRRTGLKPCSLPLPFSTGTWHQWGIGHSHRRRLQPSPQSACSSQPNSTNQCNLPSHEWSFICQKKIRNLLTRRSSQISSKTSSPDLVLSSTFPAQWNS